MKLFFKRQQSAEVGSSFWMRVLTGLRRFLLKLASVLGQKMASYSKAKQKILVLTFCLCFAGQSTWIIYKSFQRQSPFSLSAGTIQMVPLVKEPPRPTAPTRGKEIEHIHLFKTYLDSLSKTVTGSRIRDSLLKGRMHLIDTLNYLDQLYVKP